MVASNQREVVFILSAKADSSLQQAFSDVGKRALDTQERLNKSTQASVDKAAKERIKDFEKELDEVNKARVKAAAEQVRAAKQAATEQAKIERELTQAYNQAVKEQTAAAKQAAAEKARIERDLTQAYNQAVEERMQVEQNAHQTSSRLNQQLVQMAASRQGILMSGTHMARGLAMLFASNEKDAQKLMRSLFVIHGLFDLFRGAQHIVHSISGAYAAYTAAVTAAAVAQKAAAAASMEAAAAHAHDAVAAEADAIANVHLAAATSSGTIGGLSGLMGRGLTLGARGLGAIGGGSAATGAGMLVGAAGVAGIIYKLATVGPEADAREAEKHTGLIESGMEAREKATGEGEQRQEKIEQLEKQRREGKAGLERSAFQRDMSRQQRLRELKEPKLGEMTRDWTASMEERRAGGLKREPGAADYKKVEEALSTDRKTGAWFVSRYEEEAAKAASDVAERRKAQETAEADAKRYKVASVMQQVHATGAQQAYQQNYWVKGNWLRRTVGWFGGRHFGQGAAEGLKDEAETSQAMAGGVAKQAGVKESTAKEAAQATEEALKRQQETTEKIDQEKEAQSQRDIKHAEEYIAKLREMYSAHLHNAEAIEKSGRALAMQLATNPEQRHKLERAVRHYKAGRASDKDLADLAGHASPERAEEFEREIEKRHPEYKGLQDFLGKGKSQADAERAKAADEEKRIKDQENFVASAKEGAIKSADTMSGRLANILTELFDAQEKRFVQAIEKLHAERTAKAAGDKSLAE